MEKTIPIKVERNTESKPSVEPTITTTNAPMNIGKMHFMPEAGHNFYQQQPTTFHNSYNETTAEPRVHHIPIRVETRGGGEEVINARTATPTFASANHHNQASQQQQPVPQPKPPQQQAPPPIPANPPPPPPTSNRVIEVPIQICKSSSAPETTGAPPPPLPTEPKPPAPNVKVLNPINDSASEPAIVDSKQVFAVGYEPLNKPVEPEPAASQTTDQKEKKQTPFDYVTEVLEDLKVFEAQVHEFNGTSIQDKGYRFLDEMLTLCVLRLDCIEIEGNDELRKYRKSVINEVNRVTAILEAKVSGKKTGEEQQPPPPKPSSEEKESDPTPIALPLIAASEDGGDTGKEANSSKKEKKKGKKEDKPKKDGIRIKFFRSKNKNNNNNNVISDNNESSGSEPQDGSNTDLDTNNNDLKDEAVRTSETSKETLPGKETAV